MRGFGKAVGLRGLAKRDRVKLAFWFLCMLLSILCIHRVISVLQSPIITGVMWSISAVACLLSWYTLFLLPQPAATNNAPCRPIHCLFPLMFYAFVLTLYSAAVWQSHAHPATILLVASSLATFGVLYLTNQMQAAPRGNAILYRRRLRFSLSMLALLLNFIFVGMCMFPITPTSNAAAELALLIKTGYAREGISWILSHHLGERASSILYSSFNAMSQLLNGDSVKVLLLTASNLSLLGFLAYVTRQAERPVEGRGPDGKGRWMIMAGLVFSCLCFVRAPRDGNPASPKAPTCAPGQRLCPHHHQHQKQFPRKLGLNPLPVNHRYLALPRGRCCSRVDFRLTNLLPGKTPASRNKLQRGYGDATSNRYSRLQAQHSKHPPRPRHHYKICAYKRH